MGIQSSVNQLLGFTALAAGAINHTVGEDVKFRGAEAQEDIGRLANESRQAEAELTRKYAEVNNIPKEESDALVAESGESIDYSERNAQRGISRNLHHAASGGIIGKYKAMKNIGTITDLAYDEALTEADARRERYNALTTQQAQRRADEVMAQWRDVATERFNQKRNFYDFRDKLGRFAKKPTEDNDGKH